MPKVGKHSFRFQGERYEVELFYSSTNLFYFRFDKDPELRKIEAAIKGYLPSGFHNSEAKEVDLINKWSDALKEYHEGTAEVTKVIAVVMFGGADVYWEPAKSGYGRTGRGLPMEPLDCEHGFGFDYYVLARKEKGGQVALHLIDENGNVGMEKYGLSNKGKSLIILPHTPEREAYLVQLAKVTNRLALNAMDFFQSEDIVQKIDSGARLLPAPDPGKDQ